MRLSELLGASADTPAPLVLRTVNRTDDFDRVDALARRDAWARAADLAASMTADLRAPGGTMMLRPAQAVGLAELRAEGGLFAPVGVGQGKTLLTMLAATVLGVRRAVVMLPVGLRDQWLRDLETMRNHWRIDPAAWSVVPYSTISTVRGAEALESARPELIVCDEAHNLRHPTSARTKRVARYLAANPQTVFAALSGTITARSLKDYAHLAAWALRERAPVPLAPRELDSWAGALDEGVAPEQRYHAGALLRWCADDETPREGFRRRMVESPGVVATTESAIGTALELHPGRFSCSLVARELLDLERACGRWGGFDDPLDRARIVRELACGFFYEWAWPDGVVDREWLTARSGWHRAVAEYLETSAAPGLDSPALLAGACARADAGGGCYPSNALRLAWFAWEPVRYRPAPPTRVVWVSDAPAKFAASWAARLDAPGIVWVEHSAAGVEFARVLGVPWYGEGTDPGALREPATIVASIKAHGTGRNLQAWAANLVMAPPSSGAVWEQLIARTHRPGQRADVVRVDIAQGFASQQRALASARRDARYIEQTTGQAQKLNLATWVGFDETRKGQRC